MPPWLVLSPMRAAPATGSVDLHERTGDSDRRPRLDVHRPARLDPEGGGVTDTLPSGADSEMLPVDAVSLIAELAPSSSIVSVPWLPEIFARGPPGPSSNSIFRPGCALERDLAAPRAVVEHELVPTPAVEAAPLELGTLLGWRRGVTPERAQHIRMPEVAVKEAHQHLVVHLRDEVRCRGRRPPTEPPAGPRPYSTLSDSHGKRTFTRPSRCGSFVSVTSPSTTPFTRRRVRSISLSTGSASPP